MPGHGGPHVFAQGCEQQFGRQIGGVERIVRLCAMAHQPGEMAHHPGGDVRVVIQRRNNRNIRPDHIAGHRQKCAFHIRFGLRSGSAVQIK